MLKGYYRNGFGFLLASYFFLSGVVVNREIVAFIDKLRGANSLELLRTEYSIAAGNLGFDKFAYLAVHTTSGSSGNPLLISTYPTAWTTHYMDQNYFNFDPVVLRGSRSVLPFTWGTENITSRLRDNQKRLFDEAGEFGIRVGFTVPVHGHGGEFAGLTVASNDPDQEFLKRIDDKRHILHLMAIYYHARVSEIVRSPNLDTESIHLTDREVECLLWAASGKSAWEIGTILGIAKTTVLFHMKNLKNKLGVFTTSQAVAKSIILGLIRP